MTDAEIKAWERKLRDARRDVFSEDPEVARRSECIIRECQEALSPVWRAHNEEMERRRGDAYMRLME